VVRHQGRAFRSAPLSAHVAYLERDGVNRDGGKDHMFGATEDRAEMTDLKAFTRDLVIQMEHDLGTRPDWVT
jgi:type IV secretory pathway VirD2 relaxase